MYGQTWDRSAIEQTVIYQAQVAFVISFLWNDDGMESYTTPLLKPGNKNSGTEELIQDRMQKLKHETTEMYILNHLFLVSSFTFSLPSVHISYLLCSDVQAVTHLPIWLLYSRIGLGTCTKHSSLWILQSKIRLTCVASTHPSKSYNPSDSSTLGLGWVHVPSTHPSESFNLRLG